MVVGYGARNIIMENNDTSYYGRILIMRSRSIILIIITSYIRLKTSTINA